MASSVSERLQDVAAVIERLGIDQRRILAAEVVERDSGRVHIESPEFLAKIQGPYQRRPICDGDREIVSRTVDGVKLFCVVDADPPLDARPVLRECVTPYVAVPALNSAV